MAMTFISSERVGDRSDLFFLWASYWSLKGRMISYDLNLRMYEQRGWLGDAALDRRVMLGRHETATITDAYFKGCNGFLSCMPRPGCI